MIKLKELRKQNGLSQTEMADILQISQQAYSHYETGRREPDFKNIKKIADLFNVTTDYLLGMSDDPTPPNKKSDVKYPHLIDTSDLSEESRKDLLKQLDLLKLRDKIKNMNEEIGVEIMPSF